MRLRAKLPILLAVALRVWCAGESPVLSQERAPEPEGAGHHAQAGVPLHPHEQRAIEVEIILGKEGFHVAKGGRSKGHGFLLVAGADAVLSLRNEDVIPHDFISPLFTRTDIHFSGRAIGIFRKEAAGFRVPPGHALTLGFKVPFSDFQTFYDLIWCGQHQEKQPDGKELLIVVTEKMAGRT